MSRQLPYYKMYPADADTDEHFRMMTFEQRGLYWTLLNHSWLNDGLPIEVMELKKLCTASKAFDRMWSEVSKCFKSDGNRLRNPRQEIERAEAISKSASATKSVRTRYERSTNDTLRAYESESVYSVGSKEKKDGEILRAEFDDQWQDFRKQYEATGKPLIEEDFTKAHFLWAVLDFEQRGAAITGIGLRKDAGQWEDANFVPLPEKYLRSEYKRGVIPRTNGDRRLTRDEQIDKAIREA